MRKKHLHPVIKKKAVKVPKTETEALLIVYANWKARNHGYPSGQGGQHRSDQKPESRPPRGVDMPAAIAPLVVGLTVASEIGYGRYMDCVKAFYNRTDNRSVKDIAGAMGLTVAAFDNRRKEGELWLQGWLSATGAIRVARETLDKIPDVLRVTIEKRVESAKGNSETARKYLALN